MHPALTPFQFILRFIEIASFDSQALLGADGYFNLKPEMA
jgi:hypothetical protein